MMPAHPRRAGMAGGGFRGQLECTEHWGFPALFGGGASFVLIPHLCVTIVNFSVSPSVFRL